MSSVVIAGNTSGSVTLAAPDVAGTTTLTLPATSGTVARVSGDLGTPSALVGTNITGTANALVAGIGVNQTWQNVSASRAIGVTYTNTTGKPISVSLLPIMSVPVLVLLGVDGNAINFQQGQAAGDNRQSVTAIVPNGSTYNIVTAFGSLSSFTWWELR